MFFAILNILTTMRLEGDFYNIEYIERLGDRITAVVSLNPDHPVYQGHFPQKAVVPGVCTLTVIRECIGKALDRNIAFCTIKECKYVSALLPHKDLKIRIEADLSRSVQDSGLIRGLLLNPIR